MRTGVTRTVHGADPAWFAMVMATGIVSAALWLASWPGPARALLGAAAACFVVIVTAVGRRRGALPETAAVLARDSRGDEMKRYKYQALVRLLPETGGATTALPPGTSRMVIKAEHRDTHASKLFSSLVTRDDTMGTRNSGINVTFVVLGDDASDYLGTGERFALWDGHDLGLGVITRRIFV